ncbi:MAG: hypothetical protein MUF15_25635 [Acidobacteria bacterium]|jgi:hypothetical protein|nr:hypothetical protein [Acidobacteriota bacterium]
MDITRFEEKNQYHIEVYPEKNRFDMAFIGHMKSEKDIPHYVEDVEKAVSLLKAGHLLFVEIAENTKPPAFSITKLLKQSQDIIKKGGNKKTAVYISPKLMLQRMTLNVVVKLSGLDIKVFSNKDEAENWLGE